MNTCLSICPRAIGAICPGLRGIRRFLLLLSLPFTLFGAEFSAVQAQSGWYHCDIQDHSYSGPGTRYLCRPVSDDWLCRYVNMNCRSRRRSDGSSSKDTGGSSSDSGRRSVTSASFSTVIRPISGEEIGVRWIIDSGFIAAVDVWGGEAPGEVCLHGVGSLLFLDAGTSPRAESWLDSYQRDGRTCAVLDRAGTVVLMPLIAQPRACRVTTTGHLKLRASPSLAADVIGYVRRGTALPPISRIERWAQVEYQAVVGWISAAYLSEDGDCGEATNIVAAAAGERECRIRTTGHLKLRAGPSLAADVIGYVRRGTALPPISRIERWAQVEYQAVVGWISAAYLSEDGDCGEAANVAVAAAGERDCRIRTTGHLKLRAGPSLDADVIGFVRRGTVVQPISRIEQWAQVEYLGAVGWIGTAYLSEDGDCGARAERAPDTPRIDGCSMTATGHLKLRRGPSVNDEVIAYVTRGTTLGFESRNAHWVKVAYTGATGWVGAAYVSGDCAWD